MDRYRIAEGSTVDLAEHPTKVEIPYVGAEGWDGEKESGEERREDLAKRLRDLQLKYYADGRHRLLVVLQAMDTGGKDSTIRDVFGRMNPQGVKVASFGVPSNEELAHDYLWRIHPHVPAYGDITIFNRSHYEDVLVVRVDELVPEERWRRRYHHIREFERLLSDEGTTIVKFFINISKEEQSEQLSERLEDPTKHWKFEPGDLETRKKWDGYVAAYAEMITETSTAYAPWYVIPGDRRWFRKLAIAEIMVDLMEGLELEYPEAPPDVDRIVIE